MRSILFKRGLLMPRSWTCIFKSNVAGREVDCQIYSEGGYRVLTTQADDTPGSLQHDDDESTRLHAHTLIIPPTAKGTPIEIEGAVLTELRQELIENGFSDDEAGEVLAKYSA